jgi:hypothetical protein
VLSTGAARIQSLYPPLSAISACKRQVGGDLAHGPLHVPSEREEVAALAHRDRKPDGRLSVHPEHGLRRIDVNPPHLGDVANARQASVRCEIDPENVELGFERAGDAQCELLLSGLERAGGCDRILRGECGNQVGAVDAEAGEVLGGELDDDPLVLGAHDLDLRDIRNAQEPRPDALHPSAVKP